MWANQNGKFMTLIAFKTRIHVNNKQDSLFRQCVGTRRVAYNFALAKWREVYDLHKIDPTMPKPSAFDIDKIFNASKKELYPWMYDEKNALVVPSCVAQEAIKGDIKSAFNNFFTRVKKGVTPGYPKFKKKGFSESFCLTSSVIKNTSIDGKTIKLPKRFGTARLAEPLSTGKIKSTTISLRAGKWWIAFLLEGDYSYEPCESEAVGVDLGVAKFASLSNGIQYDSAKALEGETKKLKKLSRELAKMEKGSNRFKQKAAKIAKLHKHVADIRVNHSHAISSSMAKDYRYIAMEDLKLKNMTKSAKGTVEDPGKMVKQKSELNRVLLNQGLFEFRRQLEYKTARHGGSIALVNPAYTSQTCSCCNHVSKDNRKTQADFLCVACGHSENADINAAKNILAKSYK
jgi:putative transposase